MKLVFREKHLSVESFNSVEVPEFAVLTGYNGSGKSHLLQAIQNRKVIIEGYESSNIVYFNYETFKLENEANHTGQQLYSERESGWNFFVQNIRPNLLSWKSIIAENYTQFTALSDDKNKPLWDLSKADVGDDAVYAKLQQYKENIRSFFNGNHRGNTHAEGILSLIKKSKRTIDEMDRDEFFLFFRPYTFKEDFLPQQLGKVIWDYYIKLRENQVNEFLNNKDGTSLPVFTNEEFIKRHGEKPWELINDILKRFNHLEYRVTSPEGVSHFTSYHLQLVHMKKAGVQVEFGNLSSGERILMALVASIYKSLSDNHFPDIILLDEIDASLHPSMINNLLEVINDVFLQKGIKVILVTHSPTTVALTPEDSVYVVNRDGADKVVKKNKKEALEILTEGFITLDEGIKIFDEVSKARITIITEGKNSVYIDQYLKLNSITDVEIVTGVENITGKEQLKTLFDFFCKIPHAKNVIFVWDCDATKYKSLVPENNTFPFVFDQNSANNIALKGIENLFEESLLAPYQKRFISSFGVEKVEFDETRKNDLLASITSRANIADYVNFAPLLTLIKPQ